MKAVRINIFPIVIILLLIFISSQAPAAAQAAKPAMPDKDIPLIKTAKYYLGVKYVYGGTTPKGFDCSGYVQYVFAKHNTKLPRTADQQYLNGKPVAKITDLQPGDLVFFETDKRKAVSHVGIYIGNNEFINAQSSKGVAIASLTNTYWKARYIGAKRIL